MISRKSSNEPLMIERLTSVTDLVIDLKGSLYWSSNLSYTWDIPSFALNTVVKLKGILM
jgi:hypothetical protein